MVRLLQRWRVSEWLTRAVSGVICTVLASLLIEADGWYIALGVVAYGAGVAGGLVCGLFKLPRQVQNSGTCSPEVAVGTSFRVKPRSVSLVWLDRAVELDSPDLAMHNDAPHHRYYRAMEGHWRGKVRFEITDPKRLRVSTLRVMDRWSVWAMALISRHASTLVLSTSVDYASRGHRNVVLHTTRTSSLGVTLFRSREVILLEDDGRSFRMTGTQAFFPRLWKTTEWTAHGTVAPDHDGAVYHIPFFGETIEQHTRMTPQGLEVIQTTPFSRACILLQLQRPLRAEPDTEADGGGRSAFPDP